MLVTGGDYCVFICDYQVIENQLVIPFVEVVKTIPGKRGQEEFVIMPNNAEL